MVAITPTESHVVPYAAYFSSNNVSFGITHLQAKTEQSGTASCICKNRSQLIIIITFTIAEQLNLKHHSLSPFFRAAHGAWGLQYVKMQQKGQGTLINFTWHSLLL